MATHTESPLVVTGTDPATRAKAGRGLAVYLVALLLGSGIFQGLILSRGDAIEKHPLLVLGLMWTPAAASLVARIALREHPRDVSFGFGGTRGLRAFLLAVAYPLLVGSLAYGAAWATGLEHFQPRTPTASPELAFLKTLGLMATVGALFGCISAAGEEIGWRGYMLTRLIDANVKRPVLVSGLIWAAWHLPLIVSGQYAAGRYPILSAVLFVPSVVCAGYVAARLRLRSGSVWPAVLFHGAWNAIIQGAFDRFTAGGNASRSETLWTGEAGVLVVVVSLVVTVIVVTVPSRSVGRRAPSPAKRSRFKRSEASRPTVRSCGGEGGDASCASAREDWINLDPGARIERTVARDRSLGKDGRRLAAYVLLCPRVPCCADSRRSPLCS